MDNRWTKNDDQNVHRQPAHKLANDDATDESLLWRLSDPGWSIATETCQKLRNQMQNYLKYTNKRMAPFFPGNVIYDFWAQKFYKVV